MTKYLLIAVALFFLIASVAKAQADPLNSAYLPSITTTCSSYPSNVWVTDGMTKVLQNLGTTPTCTNGALPSCSSGTTQNNTGSKWGLFCGTQGEFIDFQVHWHDTGGGTSGLYVNTSSFVQSSPGSYTIPAPSTSNNNITVYREAYIVTQWPSSTATGFNYDSIATGTTTSGTTTTSLVCSACNFTSSGVVSGSGIYVINGGSRIFATVSSVTNSTTLALTGTASGLTTGQPFTVYYPIETPDPLIPEIDPYYHQVTNAWPVSVTASDNQSAWIVIYIPPAAPSGYYLGSVYVYTGCSSTLTGCSLQATLPIIVGVWQFPSADGGRIPATPTLPTTTQFGYNDFCSAIGLSGNSACIAQYDGDGAVEMMDHRWTMTDPVNSFSSAQTTMLLTGNSSSVTTAAPILSGAQTTGANYRCNNCGFGATLASFASTYGGFTPPFGSTKSTYAKLSPFYYTSDEPNTTAANWTSLCEAAYNSGATGAQQTSPPTATLVTTWVDAMNYNASTTGCTTASGGPGVTNSVDILVTPNFCPYPNATYTCQAGQSGGPAVGNNLAEYATWKAHSNPDGITPTWWGYVACGGAGTCGGAIGNLSYPNYDADASGASNRAESWLNFWYGETGELYYYTQCAYDSGCGSNGNPWTTSIYQFGQWGDGTLAIPSSCCGSSPTHYVTLQSGSQLTEEIWIPLIPLDEMRDGEQDWEYMYELSKHGYASYIHTQISNWLTNPYTYDTTGTGLITARINLGETMHQLTYPTNVNPTAPAAPLFTKVVIAKNLPEEGIR